MYMRYGRDILCYYDLVRKYFSTLYPGQSQLFTVNGVSGKCVGKLSMGFLATSWCLGAQDDPKAGREWNLRIFLGRFKWRITSQSLVPECVTVVLAHYSLPCYIDPLLSLGELFSTQLLGQLIVALQWTVSHPSAVMPLPSDGMFHVEVPSLLKPQKILGQTMDQQRLPKAG